MLLVFLAIVIILSLAKETNVINGILMMKTYGRLVAIAYFTT
jgi:hypothetical protein